MSNLYLLRHGETSSNAGDRFQGQLDIPLNETGHIQARLLGCALASHGISAIYSSDLMRCIATAQQIAGHYPCSIITDPRLREANMGEWEGYSVHEVVERWPNEYSAWRTDSFRNRPPGGETLPQIQSRVLEFTAEMLLKHPQQSIAIVAHGGSIRAIIAHVLKAELNVFPCLRIDNCAINIVQITATRTRLLRLNDTCHLDEPRRTGDRSADQIA